MNIYIQRGNDILNACEIKKGIDLSSILEGLECFELKNN